MKRPRSPIRNWAIVSHAALHIPHHDWPQAYGLLKAGALNLPRLRQGRVKGQSLRGTYRHTQGGAQ
jgi:hypothetical protein